VNFLPQIVGSLAFPAAENPTVEMVEAAFRHHGLHWRYINCEVPAERLADAVAGARAMGWAGFNCSLPHKVAVIEHLDRLGESARLIGAVNCVVRDGEGATKFVEIAVSGAASARAARRIGLAVANSPLVKTAIAGEDANWGRIVMAVGKAGEKADRDALRISIGGVEIARGGQAAPDYDEAPVARHMQGQEIGIALDVGVGRGKAVVWTCDLTHGYIDINGSYRS